MTLLDHLPFIAAAWLLASLALAIEHIALKHQPWRIGPPYTYIVGLGTVLLGSALWALIDRQPITLDLAIVGVALISTAGGWVCLLYYWDDRSARSHAQTARTAEIVGAAKGLTQEIIDRGSRGTHTPGHDN